MIFVIVIRKEGPDSPYCGKTLTKDAATVYTNTRSCTLGFLHTGEWRKLGVFYIPRTRSFFSECIGANDIDKGTISRDTAHVCLSCQLQQMQTFLLQSGVAAC